MKVPISKEKLSELTKQTNDEIHKLEMELEEAIRETKEQVEINGVITGIKTMMENPVYLCLERQNKIKNSIASLRGSLSNFEVVAVHKPNTIKVALFSIVEFKILSETLETEPRYIIEIVRYGEHDPASGRYYPFPDSFVSQIILLEEGDEKTVKIGTKDIEIEICKLHNEWPKIVDRALFLRYCRTLSK